MSSSHMLVSKQPADQQKPLPELSLNALPCRIAHDGPLSIHSRYWSPKDSAKHSVEAPESYFRGRKLLGSSSKLPDGYKAVLLQKTSETARDTTLKDNALRELEDRRNELSPEEYDEEIEDLRKAVVDGNMVEDLVVARPLAHVADHLVVWDHEAVADVDSEWIGRMKEWATMSNAASLPFT